MTTTLPARRPVTADDEPFLVTLFASTRQLELTALPPRQREAFAELQHRTQRQQLRARFPDATDELVLLSDRPIGRLWLDQGAAGTHVIDIALLPQHRSRGIGTALLVPLLADADRTGRTVTASVFATDEAALRWYRRLGFTVVDVADGSPGESAFVGVRYPGEDVAPEPGGGSWNENVAS